MQTYILRELAIHLLFDDPLCQVYQEQPAAEPKQFQASWRYFLREEDPKQLLVRQAVWVIGEGGIRLRLRQVGACPQARRCGWPAQPEKARRDGVRITLQNHVGHRVEWSDPDFLATTGSAR